MELVSETDEMVNIHRGEVEIKLGGRVFKMRPTHQFLAEIEAQSGLGSMALIARFLRREFGFTDVVTVVWAGLKAGGLQVRREKVEHLVFETGISQPAVAATNLLTNALGFGRSEKSDEDEEEGEDGQEGEVDAANG